MTEQAMTELPWLYAGLVAYALATFSAFKGVLVVEADAAGNRQAVQAGVKWEKRVLLLVASGVVLLTIALTVRWLRLGHGPFVNLFELLISQLFSLGIIFAFVYWRMPVVRPSAVVALPLLWVLGTWVLVIEPGDSVLPPTYYNNWLWVHVGFGKVFLSFCLLGTGVAGLLLLRHYKRFQGWFRLLPDNHVMDYLAWRFMLFAFIFHTLMLIAGAVWAQDAWGRYWAWDALETSSFLNWLALGAALHARTTWKVPLRAGAWIIIGIFVFAFFTYFGTPFYSEAAHKGVV